MDGHSKDHYSPEWGVYTGPQQPYATECNGWPVVLSPFVVNAQEKQELQDLAEQKIPPVTGRRKKILEDKIANTTELEAEVLEFMQRLMDENRESYVPRLRLVLDLYKRGQADDTTVQEQMKRTRRDVLKELSRGRAKTPNKMVQAYDAERARLRGRGPRENGGYY